MINPGKVKTLSPDMVRESSIPNDDIIWALTTKDFEETKSTKIDLLKSHIENTSPYVKHPLLPFIAVNLITGDIYRLNRNGLVYELRDGFYKPIGNYCQIYIQEPGASKTIRRFSHRLVMECAIGHELTYDLDVHHCEYPLFARNSIYNIRAIPQRENRGAPHNGIHNKGISGPYIVKDTTGKIIDIFSSQADAARYLHVSQTAVNYAVNGNIHSVAGHTISRISNN